MKRLTQREKRLVKALKALDTELENFYNDPMTEVCGCPGEIADGCILPQVASRFNLDPSELRHNWVIPRLDEREQAVYIKSILTKPKKSRKDRIELSGTPVFLLRSVR